MNILTAAEDLRALFNNPEHWTQGVMARNMSGHSVAPTSIVATCWCISGGIIKLQVNHDQTMLKTIRSFILDRTQKPFMSEFNDTCTYAQLIEVLDDLVSYCRTLVIEEKVEN